MRKYVICSVILAAFLYGVSHVLSGLSKSLDFWHFMLMCGIVGGIVITLAFAFDAYERHHGQQSQRSAPRDRPRLER